MKIFKKLMVGLLLCITSFAYAQTPSDALSELLKNMRSMQATFTQTILNNKGKAIQKSSGRMYLQRPSQFRWDVLHPMRQLIVTNGKRLWIYDPDLEQVTIRNLVKAAGETPAMLLSDESLSLGKEFTVTTRAYAESSWEWFILIPKDKSSVIAALKLAFDHQIIRQMQLQDHLGHTTVIDFDAVKVNNTLSASLFNFKPPAGVDVIDETKH